jgi:hypothetical protein
MLIYTTIAKNYINNWGMKQGIRELIQNAMDAQDKGFPMGVTYLRSKRQLLIFNRGVHLERSSLLLGSTTKTDDPSQRGKHGEGAKIGSLALVRADKSVTVYNGDTHERWEALIKKSPDFGTEVLTFKIVKNAPKSGNKLLFEVGNISPEEWHEMGDLFLTINTPPPGSIRKTPDGTVLLEKKYKGRIYCGGIYVCEDKELEYGYDFPPSVLTLNRDRDMVSSFDLRWNTSKLWAYLSANEKGKLYDATKMLKDGIADVEYMDKFSDYTVKGKVVEEFFRENSAKSYPVTSEHEAQQVRGYGYAPVYSSSSYTGIIREKLGSIEDLKRTVELDYALFQALTPIDDGNLAWMFEVMWKVDPKFEFKMTVAKFNLDATRSVSDKGNIVVNCNLLQCRYELLHEAIKHYCLVKKKEESQVWKNLFKETVNGISAP